MENNERGEVDITLGGKSYVMRPAYSAIVKIEKALGTRMVPLMNRLQRQDIGVEDVAVCICAFIACNKDNRNPPSLDDVGEAVVREGFTSAVLPLSRIFKYIAEAGPAVKQTSTGEVDAAPI